jgi:hypothetical protein
MANSNSIIFRVCYGLGANIWCGRKAVHVADVPSSEADWLFDRTVVGERNRVNSPKGYDPALTWVRIASSVQSRQEAHYTGFKMYEDDLPQSTQRAQRGINDFSVFSVTSVAIHPCENY